MDTNAFSRAWDLLHYVRFHKWTIYVSSLVSGLLFVLLVILLGLFVDLIVNRGRIPNFAQLSPREQSHFIEHWRTIPEEQREKAVRDIGFPEFETPPAKPDKLPPDQQFRWRQYRQIVEAADDDIPPLPAEATADTLKDWAARRKISGDLGRLAAIEHEARWKAGVRNALATRVSKSAADKYMPALESPNDLQMPGFGEEDRRPFGLLGLVVDQQGTTLGRMSALVARYIPWTWSAEHPNSGYLMTLFFAASSIVILRGILLVWLKDAAAVASLEVVTRLRRSIYHHTARQGAMTISEDSVRESVTLFTKQVEDVHEAVYYRLSQQIRAAILIIVLLALAFVANLWLAVASVLFAGLIWVFAGQMTAAFRRQGSGANRVTTHRLALLLESLGLIRLVKLYLMELFNQARIERQLTDYASAHLKRSRGEALAKPLLYTLSGLAGITFIYLAGRVVLNDGLSLPRLAVLIVSVVGIFQPMRKLFGGRKIMKHGHSSAAEVYEFLDRKGDVATYPDAEFLPGVAKSIEFADVSVKQPGTNVKLLDQVSIKIRAGQRIGIVGSNPDEQIALVSLIPRFLDPAEGSVKIDGRDVKWVTQDSLRTQIGLVLQHNLVFNDTVANNIGCGDTSYPLPQIIEAAKLAHAHQFIQKLPYGYETPIGELGHSLRPGEQFRIALARAILRDPSLYVIEEPTEHFDEVTKDLLDDTLARVLPGTTVIFLPHRMSTLRDCDRIFMMHQGKVIAEGNHRELINENELYRHLYYLEFNPFADQAAS
ncbi:ABC transporter ATP-binding protein [Zavarzinella formosa]|uniref:ABC transporter ATP-binding protein n=1 Tax=Zavarzinella formosa TaxID=360055 RepID=UPI00030C488D|nr:ABC transporter ATP-binding protein [Zavarzinella formosa]